MAKFRKKPVVIEAMQLTEADCWASWIEHKPFFGKFRVSGDYHSRNRTISRAWVSIQTLEGIMRAEIGDWIICGVNGEFYPCKPDIFSATYEEVAMPVEDSNQETRDAAKPIATGKMGAFHYLESLDEMRLAELERQSGCDQ